MIILRTSRQYIETFIMAFFSYIDAMKKTKLNNVMHHNATSDEYLSVIALNAVLNEVQLKFRKKLVNTTSHNLRIEFTIPQGTVFYKTLFLIPLDKEKPHAVAVVTNWILQMDGQIINDKIKAHLL